MIVTINAAILARSLKILAKEQYKKSRDTSDICLASIYAFEAKTLDDSATIMEQLSTGIDYRKILNAYIQHVGDNEGIDYLHRGRGSATTLGLTDEEFAALMEVADGPPNPSVDVDKAPEGS